MSSYIVKVNEELHRDPFRVLLLESLAKSPSDSLQDKSLLLTKLETQLKDLEINHESTGAKNHWLTITSGFSSALAIAGMSAITPPFGWLFGGLAVVSALTTLGSTQKTKAASNPIIETLKRHRLALDSQESLQWSVLWTYAGVDLFCFALNQASQGYVSGNNRLLRRDGDSPFSAAISYLARCQGIKYDTLVATLTQIKAGSPVEPTQVTLKPQVIGEQTRLGAVDVPSVIAPQVTLPTVIPTAQVTVPKPITALSSVLNDPYESRAIFGSQRTGKTYFAAVASRQLKEERGTNIYHINLASYGTEDTEYWQHVKDSVCCDISSMDGFDAFHHIEKAIELVQNFYLDANPAILVFDEIAYSGSTGNAHKDALEPLLNVLADKITVLSSSGKKREKAIWTIAPEFVAGSMTQDAKSVKKLSLLYVSIHPKKTVDWNGQAIGFSAELFEQIRNNYTILEPCNLPNAERVAFIGKTWMPIGNLSEPKKEVKKSDLTKFETQLTQTLEKSQAKGVDISRVDVDKVCAKVPQFTRDEVEKVIRLVLNKLTQQKVRV